MTARGSLSPAPQIFQGLRRSVGNGPPRGRYRGAEPMAKPNPFQFLQEVRSEATKVTWPTRRETLITTGMVLIMIVLSSLFFLFADTIIRWSLGFILGAR